MIGTELAEDIKRAGHSVTLINRDALPLAEILPTIAGERLKNALIAENINYVGKAMVEDVKALDDSKYEIVLANQRITADHVVASTGLILNNRLPKRANIDYLPQGICR